MRVLLVICALGLVACGGGDKDKAKPPAKAAVLDTDKVARDIEANIAKQRSIKAKVVCPSGVAQQKGLKFACLATYKGGHNTFTVDQTDDDGNVSYVGQ